jgi:hypothetical protein
MQKLISSLDRRGTGAMFVAAESSLLLALGLLAVYALMDTGVARLGLWQSVLVLCAGLAAYWTLQALVSDRIAFWLMAPVVMLPQFAPAWSHNRIGWHELLKLEAALYGGRPYIWDLALFIACLTILIGLYRIVGLKRLNRQMRLRQVDPRERRLVVRYEGFMAVALIAAGLLATGPVIAASTVLANNGMLQRGPAPVIAVVGAGAAVLFASIIWLWFRGFRAR